MGGGNVISFSAKYPERVKKIIQIVPVLGANHSVTYARAEEVNRLILKALEDS